MLDEPDHYDSLYFKAPCICCRPQSTLSDNSACMSDSRVNTRSQFRCTSDPLPLRLNFTAACYTLKPSEARKIASQSTYQPRDNFHCPVSSQQIEPMAEPNREERSSPPIPPPLPRANSGNVSVTNASRDRFSASVGAIGCWAKRSLREVTVTCAATFAHLISLVRIVWGYGKRRSLHRRVFQIQLQLGESMVRSEVGNADVRRKVAALDSQIANVTAGGGSVKALQAERRGLLIRLAENSDARDASESRTQLDGVQARHAENEQHISKLCSVAWPATTARKLRIAAGYTALCAIILLLGAALHPSSEASYDDAVNDFFTYQHDQARQGFRQLAEDGNPKAQYFMGVMDRWGLGGPLNEDAAAEWFETAHQPLRRLAAGGDVVARVQLAEMYRRYEITPPEPEKAQASGGDNAPADSSSELAGSGNSDNADDGEVPAAGEANRLYRKAVPDLVPLAEQGDIFAQFYLGLIHGEALGIEKDPETAQRWLLTAAKAGSVDAMALLGILGSSSPPDTDRDALMQQVERLRTAADKGQVDAIMFAPLLLSQLQSADDGKNVSDPEIALELSRRLRVWARTETPSWLSGKNNAALGKDYLQAQLFRSLPGNWFRVSDDDEEQRLHDRLNRELRRTGTYPERRSSVNFHRRKLSCYADARLYEGTFGGFLTPDNAGYGMIVAGDDAMLLDGAPAFTSFHTRHAPRLDREDRVTEYLTIYLRGHGTVLAYEPYIIPWHWSVAEETVEGVLENFQPPAAERNADGSWTATATTCRDTSVGRATYGIQPDGSVNELSFDVIEDNLPLLVEQYKDGYRQFTETGATSASGRMATSPPANTRQQERPEEILERNERLLDSFRKADFPSVSQQAGDGDVDAMLKLALMYQNGVGVEASREEALRWARRAADHGDPIGVTLVAGLMMEKDSGKSLDAAIPWLRRGAEAGHPIAMSTYGAFLLEGIPDVLPKNTAEGQHWIRRSASAGEKKAKRLLKQIYLQAGITPNPEKTSRLSVSEEKDAIQKLANALQGRGQKSFDADWLKDNIAYRSYGIPCYEKGSVIQYLYFEGSEGRPLAARDVGWSYVQLTAGDDNLLLDGDGRRIHEFNRRVSPDLDSLNAAAAYLCLFNRGVQAELGTFRVIYHPDMLPWYGTADDATIERVRKQVQKMRGKRDGDGNWIITCTLCYGPHIFRTTYEIAPDGKIKMIGDEAIAKNLPLFVEKYEGGRRILAPPPEPEQKTNVPPQDGAASRTQRTKPSAPAQSLEQIAKSLVSRGQVHLSGKLQCLLFDGRGDATDAFVENDASALLKVARQKDIFIFIHGFHPEKWGGRPTSQEARDMWEPHLKLIQRGGKPFAACLFRFNTLDGYGDHQPELGNFLFALRWLTDDPRLYDPDRRITLVGHSAGGNYIKHGLLLFQRHLEASGVGPRGIADTRMRTLFLATPHHGTDITRTASAGAALYDFFTAYVDAMAKKKRYEDYAQARWRKRVAAEYEVMASSRGARQLRLVNQGLAKLNGRFIQEFAVPAGNLEMLSLAGSRDLVVPQQSAWLARDVGLTVTGMGHSDFLFPSRTPQYAKLLTGFYGLADRRPYRQKIERLLRPHDKPFTVSRIPQPKFALDTKKRSQLSLAIERYIRSRLVVDIPDSEVVEIADAIERKIAASTIPARYRENWFSGEGDDRILKIYRINYLSEGDLPPETVKRKADHLVEEIKLCFDPLLLSAMPDFWDHKVGPSYFRFTDGFGERFLRTRYRGPGALRSEYVFDASAALNWLQLSASFEQQDRYRKLLPRHVLQADVIEAKYTTPNDRGLRVLYFWYKEYPDGFEDLKKKLPRDHPILKIRPPVDAAPDRNPE